MCHGAAVPRRRSANGLVVVLLPDSYYDVSELEGHFAVYDRVLREMRERIRGRHYVMTLHAEEEMAEWPHYL